MDQMTAEISINFPRRSRPRRAFSLLELLVVIGVLTVLIALAVIGFKVVGTAGKEKVTLNQLDNCKSLLNEFELTTSVANLFPTPSGPPPVAAGPVAAGHWVAPAVSVPPLPVNAATCSVFAQNNSNDNAILDDTARVLARLRSVPKNRQSIEATPPDRLRKRDFAMLTLTAPYAGQSLPDGESVVFNDGFGYPIYFVPGGGLSGVRAGYNGSGDRSLDASYERVYGVGTVGPLRSPDRRPFWASPGPDGDLTTGDDNLYSFGK